MTSVALLYLLCLLLSLLLEGGAWKVPAVATPKWVQRTVAVVIASSCMIGAPGADVFAVSGGGKDYATKDLKGDMSFAGADNRGKDFTQVDGKGVNFQNAKLAGARFYRAQLEGANFRAADLTGASLEDSGLEKTVFTDAVLKGSYLGNGFELVGSITNADFTEALIPQKTTKILCERPDATGTNPTTGADTRDSLMCP